MMTNILLVFITILEPIILGYPWSYFLKTHSKLGKYGSIYTVGFFEMLAVFEIVCVPMTFRKMYFHTFCNVYTIVIILLCVISILIAARLRKAGKPQKKEKNHFDKANLWSIVYIVLFALVLIYQLYHTINGTCNGFANDDATYIVYSSDAIASDRMYLTDPYTGKFAALDYHRVMQSFLLFFGYVSKCTGINVMILAHTYYAVVFLLMAYSAYYYVADELFEKRDNKWICVLLISMLYTFGYYSHYSSSFRMLGPIWQGKAVLAVVLVPFLLITMKKILSADYSWHVGILLCMFSIAGTSLTLIGAVTSAVIIAVTTVINCIMDKNIRNLQYLIWGCAAPAVFAGMYLVL